MRRAYVTVVGILLAFVAILAPTAAPAARATGSLPACRYDDILTTPRRYVDWSVTLVDTILRVPSTYVPPDLVSTSLAGLAGAGQVRQIAIDDLKAMADAATANGTPIAVQSAYRSFSQQKTTFAYWVSIDGYKGALKVSARPGHSEHQLGLAVDFKSDAGGPPWEGGDWALSPAGFWMHENAWKYGWILSYPRNELGTVCYSYEPWHYRYVGVALAKQIHDSKLTTRQYLWANFTTANVPPPSAGGSPSPRPRPSATRLPPESPVPTEPPLELPSLDPAPSASAPAPVAVGTDAPGQASPEASAAPVPSSDTFGDSGPAVIAMIAVAVVVLVGGWWFALRGGSGRARHRR